MAVASVLVGAANMSAAGSDSIASGEVERWGDRAAIRHAFVDQAGQARAGAWWWDARARVWSPAPSPDWHAAVPTGDARWRWIDVTAVRHVEMPGRGRLAFVLDAGDAQGSGSSNTPARVGGAKLVAMSGLTGGVVDAWWFDRGHEVVDGSRLRGFVVDADAGTAVIHDAGTAGLLVVDLASRRAHRALDGRVPAEAELTIDAAGGWLIWRVPGEAVGGRVPWAELRDARLDARALSHLVEPVVRSGWVPPQHAAEAASTASVSEPNTPQGAPTREITFDDTLGWTVARRWAQAGVSRGLGVEEATSVLQREAARGATRAVLRRVWAQKP